MRPSYDKNDPQSIAELFNSIASTYDRTNHLISFGLHKIWNKKLARSIYGKQKLLDLCAGTGEISFLSIKKNKALKSVTLLDFSQEMLEVAKIKATKQSWLPTINYLHKDATQTGLPDHSFDAITIAYGIRNIKETKKCFEEAFRLLEEEGIFSILELTEPSYPWLKLFHQWHLKYVLPFIGYLCSKDKQAYRYLSKSIPQFIAPQNMKSLLKEVGFQNILIYPQQGGIATLICAQKTIKKIP